MFSLEGKVALVTGASRGIGRAIAIALAKNGAYVAINYAGNEAAAAETLRSLQESGCNGELLRFDVGNDTEADKAISGLAERKTRLDVLVNNAGIAIDQLLIRVKPDEFEKTMHTNVGGTLWCSKSAIRIMMRKRTGRIINISSVVGESGNPGQSVYSASKAAILGMTKSLAREYASRGVTVNAITPGFIDTDMTSSLNDEVKKSILTQIPLGKMGSVNDVAAAAVFLASDEASYITGQTLKVNGGMYV